MTDTLPYLDADRPTEERLQDLLARMTLPEKIGQLTQLDGRNDAETWIREKHVGSFLHTMGEQTQHLQGIAAETRLGIPLIFGIDAIHGHAFWPGSAVFPTQLAMSCSWNPELLTEVGRITAKDVRASGVHWTFSPVLCITRDLRWGRVNETFGEDPLLIGELAKAMIKGYQGETLGSPDRILACAKHYVGYSETQGGRDAAEADLSRRKLLNYFLPPFEAAAKAGCATFMTAYQCIDGVPVTADRFLLRELLKDTWGLEGFVVTDWNNVGNLVEMQKVCESLEDAAAIAVEAGNDMAMSTPGFPDAALAAVEAGSLEEKWIDDACRRILRLKFEMGLFDDQRHTEIDHGAVTVGRSEDFDHAYECARQSVVLLENQGALPLSSDIKSVAVLGPNADDVIAQLGDWSFGSGQAEFDSGGHQRETITTILDGLKARNGIDVTYVKGCDTIEPDTSEIPSAAAVAADADVAVVVIGDSLPYVGEFCDRASLDLSGPQQELLEAVHATETPMIVVVLSSKPLTIPWVKENAAAVLQAFNPGMQGGAAIADILFGDRNPVGKLTISVPHHVGQQPMYYNQLPGWHGGKYVDLPAEPLWAFGYGLSYTSFEHSNLQIDNAELQADDPLYFRVTVTNTGDRPGTEVVQAYICDLVSTVTTPVKELIAFQRLELDPGESREAVFAVPFDRLALVNADCERVVEPGAFKLMVGSSSRDDDLLTDEFRVV